MENVPIKSKISNKERKICLELLSLFSLNGQSIDKVVTEGQLEIFHLVVFRPELRAVVLCSTQYGKSLFIALGCIVVSCIQDEVISVVAPNNEKARIIMRYYVEHIGDNIIFYSQLEKETKLERLRQEENKQRIILKNGGGIFTISVQAGNTKKQVEAAMGFGSKIVLVDEAGLVPDNAESSIFRMIAGKGKKSFYLKVGNPFYRQVPYSHLYSSWRDLNYRKIFIDYKQGVSEGRYTESFIEEAKRKPNFSVLYECEFPSAEAIDAEGYVPLVLEKDLDGAYVDEVVLFGEQALGVDVAGGGRNRSVIVQRGRNGAKVEFESESSDTMTLVGVVVRLAEEHDIAPENIFVDSVGIGKGVTDRLVEVLGEGIHGVNAGENADTGDYVNLRAQMYWEMGEWLRQGGKLLRHRGWEELQNIRYKTQSDRKIKIISKEELLRRGVLSPDYADALALTFARGILVREEMTSFTPKIPDYL